VIGHPARFELLLLLLPLLLLLLLCACSLLAGSLSRGDSTSAAMSLTLLATITPTGCGEGAQDQSYHPTTDTAPGSPSRTLGSGYRLAWHGWLVTSSSIEATRPNQLQPVVCLMPRSSSQGAIRYRSFAPCSSHDTRTQRGNTATDCNL